LVSVLRHCPLYCFRLLAESINQSTNQTINQSNNQTIKQSTNQTIKQSTNQPIKQSTNQPINQSINQTINQSNNQNKNMSFFQWEVFVSGALATSIAQLQIQTKNTLLVLKE